MKSVFAFLLGIAALLTACKSSPPENYQQHYDQSIADGQVLMAILTKLDNGDVKGTRRLALWELEETLDSLSYCVSKARPAAHPTEAQKHDEVALAKKTLDYMLKHKEEIDPRLPTTRVGIRSLQNILTGEDDVRKCRELSDYLAAKEKTLDADKP
jgi:hypothetical protein